MRKKFGRDATEPYLKDKLRESCQDLDEFYTVEEVPFEINVSKVNLKIRNYNHRFFCSFDKEN